jgi:hypothetical protein
VFNLTQGSWRKFSKSCRNGVWASGGLGQNIRELIADLEWQQVLRQFVAVNLKMGNKNCCL